MDLGKHAACPAADIKQPTSFGQQLVQFFMTSCRSKKCIVVPVSRLLYCIHGGHCFSSLAGSEQLLKRAIPQAPQCKVRELSTEIIWTHLIDKDAPHLLLHLQLAVLCGDKSICLCCRTPSPDCSRIQFSAGYQFFHGHRARVEVIK